MPHIAGKGGQIGWRSSREAAKPARLNWGLIVGLIINFAVWAALIWAALIVL